MITRPKMSIVDNFSIIPNDWVRDKRLSRKARGLLAELMSHRPGWEISLASLADGGPEGIDSIRAGVKELTDAGYLRVVRPRDEAGQLRGVDYILQDPAEMGVSPISDNPKQGNPKLADPMTKKTTSLEEEFSEDDGLFQPPHGVVRKTATGPTQVPDPFIVTAELEAWAKMETPLADTRFQTPKFVDYHKAKGTRFKDWTAAWRNWMRNAHRYAVQDNGGAARPRQAEPASKLGLTYDGWD